MIISCNTLEAVVAITDWKAKPDRQLLHFYHDEPTNEWHFCRVIPPKGAAQSAPARQRRIRQHGDFELVDISEDDAVMRYTRPDDHFPPHRSAGDGIPGSMPRSAAKPITEADDSSSFELGLNRTADAVFLGRVEESTVLMRFGKTRGRSPTPRVNLGRTPEGPRSICRYLEDHRREVFVPENNGSVTRYSQRADSSQWEKLAKYRSIGWPAPLPAVSQPRECLAILRKALSLWHTPDGGERARSWCRQMQSQVQAWGSHLMNALPGLSGIPGSIVSSRSLCGPGRVTLEAVVFHPVIGGASYYRLALQWTEFHAAGDWAVGGVVLPLP